MTAQDVQPGQRHALYMVSGPAARIVLPDFRGYACTEIATSHSALASSLHRPLTPTSCMHVRLCVMRVLCDQCFTVPGILPLILQGHCLCLQRGAWAVVVW
jgi:hypothetical protein